MSKNGQLSGQSASDNSVATMRLNTIAQHQSGAGPCRLVGDRKSMMNKVSSNFFHCWHKRC
ncbi:hypothetical protein EBZ70_02720 [bacterium]|nr:hypothetical protein [bacterium]